MEMNLEKLENYEKNLQCIQYVTDKILSHMKGHGVSFRPQIEDKKGAFSQEKLNGLVEKLMSLWTEKLRDGTPTDPATGESLAEPYIRARWELYGSYIYLVMRCSLLKGAYVNVCGGEMEERTDFAFLLMQAKRLFQSWCIMTDSDGSKKNELLRGYDEHFGLHLYRVLAHPEQGFDDPLTLEVDWPENRPTFLTDEGYVKRFYLRKIDCGHMPVPCAKDTEEASLPDGGSDSVDDYDYGYDIPDDDDYDPTENDDWFFTEDEIEAMNDEMQWLAEVSEKDEALKRLKMFFECREEYLTTCRQFVELFRQAKPEVLWGFCQDLEKIVGLYLVEQDIPPLTDTDKTLNVYSRIDDGPCREARRCERGIQWKNL